MAISAEWLKHYPTSQGLFERSSTEVRDGLHHLRKWALLAWGTSCLSWWGVMWSISTVLFRWSSIHPGIMHTISSRAVHPCSRRAHGGSRALCSRRRQACWMSSRYTMELRFCQSLCAYCPEMHLLPQRNFTKTDTPSETLQTLARKTDIVLAQLSVRILPRGCANRGVNFFGIRTKCTSTYFQRGRAAASARHSKR